MDKYRLLGERKSDVGSASASASASAEGKEGSEIDSCEVRITQQGKPRNYISYAMNLFVSLPACLVLSFLCLYLFVMLCYVMH